MDDFTETTTESYGSRVQSSFFGVIIGLVMFIASFYLLSWNEGRSVRTARALTEGQGSVISLPAPTVNAANNGKLIHISGQTETSDILKDSVSGIKVPAIKLERVVEMYQWKQSESTSSHESVGGQKQTTTTYSYEKDWSRNVIDSTTFKHEDGHKNPDTMPYSSETQTAHKVSVGEFTLNSEFTAQLNQSTSLTIEPLFAMPAAGSTEQPARIPDGFKLVDNKLYRGDSANPQIGDVRIKYEVVNQGPVSAIGKQDGNTLAPYFIGETAIKLLSTGNVSAESMFKKAEAENALMTWGIRLGGFVLMFLGLKFIIGPIIMIARFIPFLGDMLSFVSDIIIFPVSFALTFITIAVAWIAYRPVVGGSLFALGIAGGIAILYVAAMKRKQTAKSPGQ